MSDAPTPAPGRAERERLERARDGVPWKRWGPYLAERAWATVREDYSADGDAWAYFGHDEAIARAYRWGEDGLGGICDDEQRLCLALCLWNERDPILKERAFGLTAHQGNHGEDVKELYFYLDALPTSSYLRFAYLYPQASFPYRLLIEENARRAGQGPEFEILDTGVFDDDRFFDVEVEYAKADPEAIVMSIRATNRGPDEAPFHLLPTLWFRNSWAWDEPRGEVPSLRLEGDELIVEHPALGRHRVAARAQGASVEWLFTDNESNDARLFGAHPAEARPFTKDAFHRLLVEGEKAAVNPAAIGTKAAAHARWTVPAGGTVRLAVALVADGWGDSGRLLRTAHELTAVRRREADDFYGALAHPTASSQERLVQRQALAGMLWSLQHYELDVARWRRGDVISPPAGHALSRNRDWGHLRARDILAVPDTWEYPWFAAWDLAFHAVTLGLVDPDRAKAQLLAILDDRFLHPDGQIPSYEWEFSDLNPPVQAWAALRVFRRDALMTGHADREFLERMLHGLMLNFGWWVNREDSRGDNVFEGGFLGLDNIAVIDRSEVEKHGGGTLEQADATGWMAFFALELTEMALELALQEPIYVELAKHFLGRFIAIGDALVRVGGEGLWDEDEGFFFDVLRRPDGSSVRLKAFSVVGLIPILAARALDPTLLAALPAFTGHLGELAERHPAFFGPCDCFLTPNEDGRRLVALVDEHRLDPVLGRLLDEDRFLSSFGVRSLSRRHADPDTPVDIELEGMPVRVRYEPGEAETKIKGGNSNWRGPVWLPINYLLVQALRQFGRYYGDRLTAPVPAPSDARLELRAVADELARRLISLYLPDREGLRPALGRDPRWRDRPGFRDRLLFYEYFHGETGIGLGAAHQTGWTALLANLIDELHRPGRSGPGPAGGP